LRYAIFRLSRKAATYSKEIRLGFNFPFLSPIPLSVAKRILVHFTDQSLQIC